MPISFLTRMLTLSLAFLILGCRQHTSNEEYPVIYNAWSARYQYDPLTRQMNAVSNNEPVGLSWSRDQQGRLDFMYYYSGGIGRDENLLTNHKQNLDKKRDMQWESERESRIQQVEEMLARIDSNETDQPKQEVVSEEEDTTDDFLPFMPVSTIPSLDDMGEDGAGQNLQGAEDAIPSIEDGNMVDEAAAPELSPFAPLPEIE